MAMRDTQHDNPPHDADVESSALTNGMSSDEPDLRAPHLVPGHSALWWLTGLMITLPLVLIDLVCILIASYGLPLSSPIRNAVVYLGGACEIVCGIVMFAGLWGMLRAVKRERHAGYTTHYAPAFVGRGYWDLWQLDPETGAVIRRAGDHSEAKRRKHHKT